MRLSGEVTEESYTKREHYLVGDALYDSAKCTCQHGVGTVILSITLRNTPLQVFKL